MFCFVRDSMYIFHSHNMLHTATGMPFFFVSFVHSIKIYSFQLKGHFSCLFVSRDSLEHFA